MTLFQNKFRIESSRIKDFDYSSPSWYYVTINTQNHVYSFGSVKNSKMILSDIGKIVNEEWLRTKKIRINIDLDHYVIMPNHFHGIIILNETGNVETRRGVSLPYQNQNGNKFSKPITNSLSIIINQFKGSVKRWCNKNGHSSFKWQPLFYDHIIRNEKELYKIRKYIADNPLKWEIERENSKNLVL